MLSVLFRFRLLGGGWDRGGGKLLSSGYKLHCFQIKKILLSLFAGETADENIKHV